jgi:hypothetical protein
VESRVETLYNPYQGLKLKKGGEGEKKLDVETLYNPVAIFLPHPLNCCIFLILITD